MIERLLEKKIVNLIASKTLKVEISRLKYHFREEDLVKIINTFSPCWDDRINLLNQLKMQVENKDVVKYINRIVEYEQKCYDIFIKEEEDFVYEVSMEPNSIFSRYLCPNYEAALITAKTYLRSYHLSPRDFTIDKRRIAIRKRTTDIDNDDEPSGAGIDSRNRIKYIYTNIPEPNYEDLNLTLDSIHYPPVFKKGDLVSYSNRSGIHYVGSFNDTYSYQFKGEKVYGINSFDNDTLIENDGEKGRDVSCFLYLNCDYVKKRTVGIKNESGYYDFFMQHEHVDYGFLEKCDLKEMPDNIKEDYIYVMSELNKIEW